MRARESVADVATRLRRAREEAGLDIQEISARTKIKPVFLRAIEGGNYEQLPGHFFTRTFLRTYARELGLDADEVVAEYDDSCIPVELAPVVPLPKGVVRSMRGQLPSVPPVKIGVSAWAVVVVAAIMLFIGSRTRSTPDLGAETGAVGTSGVVAAGVGGAAPVSPEPVPETLRMEITPTATTWVTATADGKRALYRVLEPGERVMIDARREILFRVGNAGAFEYSINGVPGKPVGRSGQVREFEVTRDNYRSFRR